ncbi:MAG: diguanylate cyclase, partial [Candidatus Atribacteria bacterium]|nr:diguanylate cyclase [Candidatus Atribacteria bacterium]
SNHLQHLKNGEIDLLTCIAYSSERARMFDFSEETVWLNWGTVYTHPSIAIQSFLDLNLQKIFVVSNDIYHQGLREIVTGFGLDCQLIEVEDYKEALEKAWEEKGVGVVSRTFGLLFGPRYNLRPSPLVFSPVSLRFASPKGKNQEILQTLDRWLASLKEDPRSVYYEAIHEFLEIHVPQAFPRWVSIVLLLVAGGIAVLLTFILLLRHQVARKTKEVVEKNTALQNEIGYRREAEAKLAFQLQVEHLLTQISTHLFSGGSLDVAAHLALETVGNFLQAEYLLVQLPQGQYSFIHPKTEKREIESFLPEILKIPSVRETWAKEGEILFSDWENLIPARKKSVFFALAFHFPDGEGFLEGMLGRENDTQEEQIHHIPLIARYLRALFEYIWAVKQRQERDRWFMVTLRSLGDAVITTDAEGEATFLNPVAEKLTGWSQEEARGKPVEEVFRIVNEKTGEPVESPVQRVLRSGKTVGLANHTLLIHRDGEKIAIDDSGAPILDEGGVIRGVVLVFRDVTERRRLEAQIRESERNYRLLFNSMLDGFALLERIICDGETVDYRVLEANPSLKRLLPHFDRVEGKLVSELFPNWKEQFRLPLLNRLSADPPQKHEVAIPELDAFWEITSFTISPERIGVVIADITARKKAEEKIRYFTFHDSLTGLYNRLFAEEELKRLDDGRHLPLSILFADLNGLKFVNDTFGHHRGDLVLQEAAQVLRNSCRESDIVARFGGDEFLIILPSTPSSTLAEIAERINARSLEVQGEDPFFLGPSVGLATKNDPSQDLWAIIQEAEEHSYERKLKERTVYQGESTLTLFEKALFHLRIEESDEL